MTPPRLRFVLAAIGLSGSLGSLIVLAAGFGATIGGGASEPSNLPRAFDAVLEAISPAYARQQALADVSRLRLQAGPPQSRGDAEAAQAAVSSVLASSPTDSELWLAQARLSASLRAGDQQVAEALKMSYLTAPGNFALMPGRLEIAMTTRALSDPVLEVLAEGDIRAILLKRPDLADRLVDSYRRASEPGRAFLARTAAASDPQFAARLAAQQR